MSEIEVRKLPKKSVAIIIVIALICLAGFVFIQQTKNMKMEEVLATLGHKNIENIKVINKMNVEDKKTKAKSTVYKVVFSDLEQQKECIGFIIRANRGGYSKDLDCK
jgi:hypothetical protein